MKIHSTFVVGLLQALHPMLLVPLRVDDSTATTSLSRRSRSSSGRSDDLKFADRLQVCSWFFVCVFFLSVEFFVHFLCACVLVSVAFDC